MNLLFHYSLQFVKGGSMTACIFLFSTAD